MFWLKAPRLDSRDLVTLANAEVSSDGSWVPGSPEALPATNQVAGLVVPHATAVLVRLTK